MRYKLLTDKKILELVQTEPFSKRPDSSKLEEIAENDFVLDKNGGKFSKRLESIVGKGEISPFPTVFSKDLYCRHVKTKACLGKG